MLSPIDRLTGAGAETIKAVSQRELFNLQLSFQFDSW